MPIADVTNLKIVVTGPFAAGKTTFIGAVSEIPVVATEAETSEGRDIKAQTTVTLDFGKISVDDDDARIEVFLFGTPGQSRFDFMWEILSRGMIGYILLVDSSQPATWPEALDIRKYFESVRAVPSVVAANRATTPADIETLRTTLELPDDVQILPCSAIDKDSVKAVLLALLVEILENAEAAELAADPSR